MVTYLLLQTSALVIGFIIDFFVGDPYILFHPVRLIGSLISALDDKLRIKTIKSRSQEQAHTTEETTAAPSLEDKTNLRRGVLVVLIVTFLSAAVPAALLFAAWTVNIWLYLALESVMCWQIIAARQLARESGKVARSVSAKDIEGARYNVSMIVGRDTASLDEAGICRAAVETVAENASDGVVAPIMWTWIFGAAGGFFYKAVNTMDSMIAYKNDKYLYFGRAAAMVDDIANFIPARVTAVAMIAAALLCGQDAGRAYRVFLRDRYKHASPNSAQTEAVCAGALGIRLAGDAVYNGVVKKKEYIGDDTREIVPKDIFRANLLMYVSSALVLAAATAIKTTVILLCL